jgi:radical SAM-linked protein
MEETKQKQDYFYRSIRSRHIAVKWHDPRMSFLEGILSRGDEKTGQIVEEAFRLGARFDGWGDLLKFHCWEESFSRRHFTGGDYLRERGPSAALPWDFIDTGVSRNFLLQEAEKASAQELTPDCRFSACHNCGVCDHKHIKPRMAVNPANALSGDGKHKTAMEAGEEKYRLLFEKKNQARFLSHLEVSSALVRALRQGGFKFIFSRGFHPLPRISFATATAVGMESLSEYADIRIVPPAADISAMIAAANKSLPRGMAILEAIRTGPSAPALSEVIQGFSYEALLPRKESVFTEQEIHDKIHNFLASSSHIITKKTGEKIREKDIRPFVDKLIFRTDSFSLQMEIKWLSNGTLNPRDLLREILFPDDEPPESHITKTKTILKENI